MTVDESPESVDATTEPAEIPASVSISWPTGTVWAGRPVKITVNVDRGTGWTWDKERRKWEKGPLVTFTQSDLYILGRKINSPGASGFTYTATFPNAGNQGLSADAETTAGNWLQAPARIITVAEAVPPAFTWTAPTDGAAVDLGPGGGQTDVRLTAASDQFQPFTVSITRDGLPALTEQFSGTSYAKTVTFGPAPLGSRSISVKCADPNGLSSTQTRSLVGRDSVPPTVTLDPFSDRQTVRSFPHTVTLTGRTNGAASAITGVAFAFTNGPSGAAQDTSSGRDWSTWRVQAPLATTGTYPFTVTVTNSRRSTVSASGTITLVAQGPPVFTWATPAAGDTVDLGPTGGQVAVRLTSGSDQFYPFTVSIAHDGLPATTDQYTGTEFTKTVTFGPTPVGARSISVTCADPNGLSSTQTRSLTGRDSVPPTVALDPFEGNQTATSLPHPITLTGTTNGAPSGITEVAYVFDNGPSGVAQDTSPGGDWSAWRLRDALPTTGTYTFRVIATNSRGSTVSASGTINLNL